MINPIHVVEVCDAHPLHLCPKGIGFGVFGLCVHLSMVLPFGPKFGIHVREAIGEPSTISNKARGNNITKLQ